MPTSARVRRRADVGRIGKAVSQPGIDPRTWVTMGRVEDDPKAVRWIPQIGWVADVRFTGGPLDGETQVPCRVAGGVQEDDAGTFYPLAPGCAVAVLLPAGTSQEAPIIVGRVNNRNGCAAPLTINGLPITPGSVAAPSVPRVSVSPFDTEIHKSPYHRREQFDGDRTTQAKTQTIAADTPLDGVLLGSDLAQEAFIKGTSYLSNEAAFYGQLASLFTAAATAAGVPPAPTAPLGTPLGNIAAAFTQAAAAAQSFASLKIKGE